MQEPLGTVDPLSLNAPVKRPPSPSPPHRYGAASVFNQWINETFLNEGLNLWNGSPRHRWRAADEQLNRFNLRSVARAQTTSFPLPPSVPAFTSLNFSAEADLADFPGHSGFLTLYSSRRRWGAGKVSRMYSRNRKSPLRWSSSAELQLSMSHGIIYNPWWRQNRKRAISFPRMVNFLICRGCCPFPKVCCGLRIALQTPACP